MATQPSHSRRHRRRRSQTTHFQPRLATLTRPETPALGSLLSTLLVLVLVVAGPAVLGGARPWVLLPMLFVTWALLAVQGARLLRPGLRVPVPVGDLADVAALAFVIYALARYFTSPAEWEGRMEVALVLAGATLFWTGRYGIIRRTHAIAVLVMLVAVAVGVTIFGLLLRTHPGWTVYGEKLHLHVPYIGRLMGSYGCPNHYGFLAAAAALTAFALGCFSRFSWVVRILFIYLGLMLVAGAVLSYSRGTWLGLTAGLIFLAAFALRQSNLRWYWPVGLLVLALGGLATAITLVPGAQLRFQEAVNIALSDNVEAYERVALALDSLRIFEDNPLWGTGPGSFVFVHPRYQGPHYKSLAIYTHNDYLNLLADYGLVGAVICLIFIAAVCWRLYRHPGVRTEALDRVVLAAGGAVWSAILIHSLVDFNMHIPANAMILLLLTGMGMRAAVANRPASGLLSAAWTLRPVGVLALLAAAALGWMTLRTARGYYPRMACEGRLNEMPREQALALAHEAAAADPTAPNFKLLGDIYRVQAGEEDDFVARYPVAQQAVDWYRRAHEANPLDDTLLVYQAMTYDLMGRQVEAYLLFGQAVENQPHNGYFHYMQGMHFWRRGMLEMAERSFQLGAHSAHGREENRRELPALQKSMKRLKELGVTEAELRQATEAMRRTKLDEQRRAAAGEPVTPPPVGTIQLVPMPVPQPAVEEPTVP